MLRDFYELYPEKFLNVTNGVTPRRFLALSNPGLSELITRKIGDGWVRNLEELRRLEDFAEDLAFHRDWRRVKLTNKGTLAAVIKERTGMAVNPATLFDIQVKRIHEYKRQHLNVLHIITLYNRMKRNPEQDITPRTFIFGGKAAPGYFMAKLIIKLINSVAEVVNHDPDVQDRLKVVFFPDFNVKNGQMVYPAADLSEQISTAGKEASGTGNMKFAMNGALTIGTLDGANVEIREEVGPENFFLFGLTAEEAANLRAEITTPWGITRATGNCRKSSISSARDIFPAATPSCSNPWCHRSFTGTNISCWPITGLTWTNRMKWATSSAMRKAGPACPSSTSPAWANSPPTGPSGNTASISGRSSSYDQGRLFQSRAVGDNLAGELVMVGTR